MNKTTKSRKNQDVLGIIGNGHHQTKIKDKHNKNVPQTNEKTSRNQSLQKKSHQRDMHLGSPLSQHLYLSRKKEEEEMSELKIEWRHQFKDSKTSLKRVKEGKLMRPITSLRT